jgi:FkbM family methyltransferase
MDKYLLRAYDHILEPYIKSDCVDYCGIKLPLIPGTPTNRYSELIYDCFAGYLFNGDKWDKEFCNKIDKTAPEGVYCYTDGDIDITIHSGDVILDLGAWYGDFSAYAAKVGATAYAFEPDSANQEIIRQTIELNSDASGKIHIVPYGAAAETQAFAFLKDSEDSMSSKFDITASADENAIQCVALDDWVKRENIKRVDFIKADIEGFEREMLKGACELLRTQAPILSLCTYHIADDPKVMRKLILDANSKYKIIQRRCKLFAYVPK